MKKLLALVLALVMTLGLATIGANAADTTFGDEDSITHKEAVAVMNAIGVLQGDNNGKFNPNDSLTREQGAKIIAYMLRGKEADSLPGIAVFSDVAADRWSAGPIAYCKSVGILDGNGDGTFSPEAPLTGAAFGKMLLTALGYQSDREGLVGGEWTLNVARLVNTLGLADKLSTMPYTTAINRDQAAQMSYNTLTADMVDYNGNGLSVDRNGNLAGLREYSGNATYDYQLTGAGTVLPTAAPNPVAMGTSGNMQFCDNYFPNLKLDRTAGNARDAFGNPVAYWYLANDRLDTQRTDAKTITKVSTADKVVTYTDEVKVSTIYADLGLGANATFGIGAANGQVYIDGAATATQTGAAVTKGTTPVPAITTATTYVSGDLETASTITMGDSAKFGGKGILTTVSYTANQTPAIVITMKTTFLAQAIADYNTNTKVLKLAISCDGASTVPTEISGDPSKNNYFELATGAKEDDLFWVAMSDSAGAYTIEEIEPLTNAAQDVAVTAYKNGETVTAGGDTYSYAAAAKRAAVAGYVAAGNSYASFAGLYTGNTNPYTMNNGATYDIFLDPYGYVLGAKEHTSANKMSDYAVVISANVTALEARAKLLFSDGSNKTVEVSKVVDGTVTYTAGGTSTTTTDDLQLGAAATYAATVTKATGDALQAGRFYKYHVDKNGAYELTFVADGTAAGQQKSITSATVLVDPTKGTKAIESTAGTPVATATVTNDTTLLVGSKVYTGVNNFPTVNAAAGNTVTYLYSGTSPYILGVYATGATTSTAGATDYFYVFTGQTTKVDADGDPFVSFDVLKNGELTTLDFVNGTTFAANDMIKVTAYTDGQASTKTSVTTAEGAGGYVQFVETETAGAANQFTIKDGTITAKTSTNSAVLADDCTIYLIDGRDGKDHTPSVETASVINTLDFNSAGTIQYQAIGLSKTNTTTSVSTLYIIRLA